jgi:serine/threonine protein kinase
MDRYHIYEEIGKGNYSQVYKGREKKKIEYVAIKRVDKNMMNNVSHFPYILFVPLSHLVAPLRLSMRSRSCTD